MKTHQVIFLLFFSVNAFAGPAWNLRFIGHGDGYEVEQISSSKIVGQVSGFGVSGSTQKITLQKNILGKWSGQFGERKIMARPAISGVKACYNEGNECYSYNFNERRNSSSVVGGDETKTKIITVDSYKVNKKREINFHLRDSRTYDTLAEMRITQDQNGNYSGLITKSNKLIPAIAVINFNNTAANTEDNNFNLEEFEENFELISLFLVGPLIY